MDARNLLIIVVDMTPAWWGLYPDEEALYKCLEAILAFGNLHLMLSSSNELAIIGVTPVATQFLWPLSRSGMPSVETSRDGQYDLLSTMNASIRQAFVDLVTSCTSLSTHSVMAGGLLKSLCYFLRRCRELSLTRRLQEAVSDVSDLLAANITDRLPTRILVVKTADDNPSQYLSLMNTVFTSQKLHIPIDVCVLPPPRLIDAPAPMDASVLNKRTGRSTLFQQAADLTGGIYVHIPHLDGLLQYLISVFLPSPSLRPKLLLPDLRSSGGVDFRAACFCHRRLIDIGYVCSICLSVFCEFTPLCTTCNSAFALPNIP